MAAHSKIEWTNASWNPIRARRVERLPDADPGDFGEVTKTGWHCEKVSEACRNCYAEAINKRLGTGLAYKPENRAAVEVFLDEKILLAPLKWKKPRKIFVCSMTDLFAEWVTDEMLDRIFAVMALAPQHTFQVLTKRPGRMREWFEERWQGTAAFPDLEIPAGKPTSRRDQVGQVMMELADSLGMIDPGNKKHWTDQGQSKVFDRLSWPRDQCKAAGVPFFFKQWGEWEPRDAWAPAERITMIAIMPDGSEVDDHTTPQDVGGHRMARTGKARAGRLLNGREHNGFPRIK